MNLRTILASALVVALAACAPSPAKPSPPADAPRVEPTDAHAAADDIYAPRDVATDVALLDATADVPADVRDDAARDVSEDLSADLPGDARDASDAPPSDASTNTDAGARADVPVDAPSCLRAVSADLVAYLARAPYATRSGPARMTVYPTASPAWQAARRAAMAWAADDCAAFASAARDMGYDAIELTDAVTRRRHWVLIESTGASYNGVFAFVAPGDRARARPLVIDSPHLGYDFTDDRAPRVYRDTAAVAFLQNTAHRCNSDVCSGCSAISNYACGGCVVESDVVHSTGQLFYAVYDGLESARDDLHFEYHGASASNNLGACVGSVHLSQASSRDLTAAVDDGTYPHRLWLALERSLGDACVCYHQRETGCALNGAGSTPGRRTNQEAGGATVNVCTASPAGLAGRFAHFEAYNVPVARVIEALNEAVPLTP